MRKPLSLRLILALAVPLTACAFGAVTAWTIGSAATRRIEREIGASLATLADQMQDKLDRGLFERYREITATGELFGKLELGERSRLRRLWIEQLQLTYRDYAWIGYADRNGRVLTATGADLEGVDVSARPWFPIALKAPTVSDVHGPVLLAGLTAEQDRSRKQFVDIAAPVRNASGETIGVLVAILNWNWASEVRESLFGNTPATQIPEVLVLNREGLVLLGPDEHVGTRLDLKGVKAALDGKEHVAVEEWPDGRAYVTGYARTDGYRSFAGLQWFVLVRRPAAQALAPVRQMQTEIAIWSLIILAFAALISLWLAMRVAEPLLRLASVAERARVEHATPIPVLGGYREIGALSQSLSTLVADLQAREASLSGLNQSLDALVKERTAELQKRNEALATARDLAERATAAKSRFLSAASHDLRQPLHAMMLLTRALSRRVSGGEGPPLVAQLEQALAALKGMFDGLLNLSRIDAGLISARPRPVSARQIIDALSIGFEAEARHRGLQFRSRSIDATLATDPVILETILRNLVSNALKFTRQGGVLLAARRRREMIVFEVIDTGPGIAPAEQSRIFREFERSKADGYGPNEGLGLGLSIVEQYGKLLGASIELRSDLGKGARFSVVLPAALGAAPIAEDGPTGEYRDAGLDGIKILVVDDEPLILAGIAADLGDRGGVVRSCAGTEDANAAISDGFKPDAAVVDLELEGSETGPELMQRLEKRLGRTVPTLLLSGRTDLLAMKKISETGLVWMTKPAEPDAIASKLRSMCRAARTVTADRQ